MLRALVLYLHVRQCQILESQPPLSLSSSDTTLAFSEYQHFLG